MRITTTDRVVWDWRKYFTKVNLQQGEHDADIGNIVSFECDPEGHWARAVTRNNFVPEVLSAPVGVAEYIAYPEWSSLTGEYAHKAYKKYYYCTCSQGSGGMRCRHLAALMILWERQRGPFIMSETEEEHAARLERMRLERERERKQAREFNAIDYVLSRAMPAPQSLRFPVDAILRNAVLPTNQYEAELADALRASEAVREVKFGIQYSEEGRQLLSAEYDVDDERTRVSFTVSGDAILGLQCGCGAARLRPAYSWYYSDKRARMCSHALAAWTRFRDQVILENPGDSTDYNGMRFLSLLTADADRARPDAAAPAEGPRGSLALAPRVYRDNNDALRLGFDLGRVGERTYAVKSLEKLADAVEKRMEFPLSKTTSIDFREARFTEPSTRWFELIQSRVRAVKRVNAQLYARYYSSVALPIGAGIPMEGADLDAIYELAQGGELLYQYGGRKDTCPLRVEEALPIAELRLEPVKRGQRMEGVRVVGNAPRLLRGQRGLYMLDRSCFGRVKQGGLSLFDALRAFGDGSGAFSCVIGERKFAEFYYRVLPALQNNPQVRLTDDVSDALEALVPPEAAFTFYIDLDERVTCRAVVSCGDRAFELNRAPEDLRNRDRDQEARVAEALARFFPETDPDTGLFWCPADDASLLRVLTEGVAALSRFGEVKGSDAFKRVRIRPVPTPRFSVRLEGGLIDLSIKTKDLTEDELLELMDGYRLKKRWHRLKNGDFVDLKDTSALRALEEAALAMDVDAEALIRGDVQAPSYRALYVDRLLEAHDAAAASRDKGFKALIRSFQTIRDSDFEAPEALQDVLRPYQLYGFRWMSTLAQAGFGGILADEMGLGKTVQALSFLRAQRLAGETRPALVVCPASLVYNWREECRRFTPEASVGIVAGTIAQRKAMLGDMDLDLYVTSYDLLKRDIALYDGARFSTVLLDEAQYVKNRRAAVSKAVRVLNADHRFALTGTPIENRVSELWSIFDFLMPGFLYSESEFAERFEGPIMKQKDAAVTAKLARMTEPFILRRRKADVLKDLPEKLEETRSAEMKEDQRKLYDAQLVRMKALLRTSGGSGEDKLKLLAELTRLRQLCCDPSLLFEDYAGTSAKRLACLELIQSAVDGGHRMLVFSQFTSMLRLLAADLKAAGIAHYTLTGATPKQERVRLVNDFNEGDVPVFLISLRAGGTGLNLTGADVVIHYDPWWNLAVQNQATDRSHRIGQEKTVTVVKLIAADSIEERIVELQETKRDLAEAIISGQNTSLASLSKEELMALLGD